MRKRIGSYKIEQDRDIGHGQSAAVYLARHVDTQELVALKLFHVFAPEEKVQRTFLRETEITTRLNHPNVIRVLHIGFDRNNPYYVMSYARGGNLRSKVAYGSRLTPEQVDVYLLQIAAAIQHAHDNGVVHCDLKPENVLIAEDGRLLLADFGIARSIQTIQAQSTQGAAGTPLYMAPEQFRGKPSIASDQYALGILAYELLTGRTPFTGNNAVELMGPHLHEAPPSLTAKIPDISSQLEAVIFKALEKKAADRFPSVLDFALAFHKSMHETTEISSATEVSSAVYSELINEPIEERTAIRTAKEGTTVKKVRGIRYRLRDERKRRGWTQGEMAELLGVATVSISSWENGETQPGIYHGRKLANLFGISINELERIINAFE